ncbi:MAG: Hsp20/alpha crystallin family protein [Planctomycetes bacterium]|jgi:HSP20 family protein|nr:Hsp20/alpha crystallin family protein [Planctomycetota bacterium]
MFADRWFPFFDVAKTLEEMDRALNGMRRPLGLRSVPRGTFPAINLYEKDDAVMLVAEIPGVKPDELDLTVLGDSVTLKGQRRDEPANGNRAYRRERAAGPFSRTVALPESIDPDSVRAEYRDGILRVQMGKAQKAKAKRIQIRS